MRFSSPTAPLLAALAATAASATNLFVADYGGNITTLSLRESNGSYALTQTAINSGCAPNPAWLTLDAARRLLFCTNEANVVPAPNGSVSSFAITANGSLDRIANITAPTGPVHASVYGDRGLVVAHYESSAVTTFTVSPTGNLTLNDLFSFTLAAPGPDAERQDAPHPHQAVVDPTGQYILVPDLG